jgi:pimeloyl-ACP methyl ester carboxylesterase
MDYRCFCSIDYRVTASCGGGNSHLADEYTIVARDAPGCGLSPPPAGSFGLRDVARYLAALVDALGS